MAKLDLINIANLQNETSAVNTINTNSSRIETAMENTLSRDGSSPNEMNANLDMNHHVIYNLVKATAPTEPIRKQEFDNLILDVQAQVGPAYLTSYSNSVSGLSATNVQDAIDELDTNLETAVSTINSGFDERVDDRVSSLLQAGPNITLNYNDISNTLTISSSSSIDSWITPADFSAVGDGIANDTTAIQNMLNDGRPIYLTSGTYLCSSLTFPAGTRMVGTRSAILKQSSASGTFITCSDNTYLEGFTVDGTHTNDTVASGFISGHYGIRTFSGSAVVRSNIVLKNLLVKNFGDTGIDSRLVTNLHVEGCEVHRCGYGGIMTWSGLNVWVGKNHIHDIFPGNSAGGASPPFQNAYGGTFSNFSGERASLKCIFSENIVENVPTWEGLDEHNGEEIYFINNIIRNCSQGIACQHSTVGQPARRITIVGNEIYGFGSSLSYNGQTNYPTAGIIVVGGADANQGELVKINGNLIYNIGDNRPSPGDSGAIAISNIRNFQINDNQIFIAFRYGIRLSDNTVNSLLYGTIHGNVIDSVTSVSGVQMGISATSRVLSDVQTNFLQNTGGAAQVGSPTYTTTFSNNRII